MEEIPQFVIQATALQIYVHPIQENGFDASNVHDVIDENVVCKVVVSMHRSDFVESMRAHLQTSFAQVTEKSLL